MPDRVRRQQAGPSTAFYVHTRHARHSLRPLPCLNVGGAEAWARPSIDGLTSPSEKTNLAFSLSCPTQQTDATAALQTRL